MFPPAAAFFGVWRIGLGEPGALVGLYDLVKWYGERTERFPKPLRVTLGDRIDGKLLDMLELGVRARYTRSPGKLLWALNMDLAVLRYLTRLAHDRGCLSPSQYEYAARALDDIGRQVGGWLRHTREDANAQGLVSKSLGVRQPAEGGEEGATRQAP